MTGPAMNAESVYSVGVLFGMIALGTAPYCYRWIEVNGVKASFSTEFLTGFDDWINDAMNPDNATDVEHTERDTYYLGNPNEQSITLYY